MLRYSSKWLPTDSLSSWTVLIYSGSQMAPIVFNMVIALLNKYHVTWPYVFYTSGCIGIVFLLPWQLLMYSTPEEHPSNREKVLTENEDVTVESSKRRVPWVKILTNHKSPGHRLHSFLHCW